MVDSKDYIKYIKTHFCLICASSPVDPDHLETIGMGGNRKSKTIKDFSCVPLCRQHHTERHRIGTKQFEAKYNINLFKEAFYLLRKYFTN